MNLVPVPKGMCPAFYEFMAAGASRSDSGEILMIGQPKKARRHMTNHELARQAAEKIGSTLDIEDAAYAIADTYAPAMAELERLRRQVAFVRSLDWIRYDEQRGYECSLCDNKSRSKSKIKHDPDCPHAKDAT